jgi:hypothetical protein
MNEFERDGTHDATPVAESMIVAKKPYTAPKLTVLTGERRALAAAHFEMADDKIHVPFAPGDVARTAKTIERLLTLVPSFYVWNRKIVTFDSEGSPHAVEDPTLVRELTETYAFQAHREGSKPTIKLPTERIVRSVLDAREWPGMRKVRCVMYAPTMLSDGSILGEGFRDGMLVIGQHKPLAVPDRPGRHDAAGAVAMLLDLLKDFPLDQHGRSAWLALLLSVVGRELIAGCVPLFAFDGNQPGVGKTLLVTLASLIATGKTPHVMARPRGVEESLKAYYAASATGAQCILIDNIHSSEPLADETLEMALTSGRISKRGLCTDGMISTATCSVWTASGNGIQLGSDMSRRCIIAKLRAGCEAPADREGLPDIRLRAESRQPELLGAAMTIVRYWLQSNLQAPHSLGSFEQWSQVVDGALVYVGQPSVVVHQRSYKRENDDGRDALGGFLHLLKQYPNGATSAQLCADYPWQTTPDDSAKRYEGRAVLERIAGRHYTPTRVGSCLRGAVGREVDGASFLAEKQRDRSTKWCLRFFPSAGNVSPSTASSAESAEHAVDASHFPVASQNHYEDKPTESLSLQNLSAPAVRGTMNGSAE